ncbi:hypothetical protein F9C07_2143575 [Aspergillus flavus]|uniref:Uncharacterized protein n=1 Tax=Aspergillus flavus (strain ATCC 200026 / FGSC A1120 / IAM 13836 / NRRL 3357 / JCM 12722 / SRRC 167) TaxID=332952 RepID=A0A7U2MWM9_ASPFN|nr:hypothetical protein F9C07_2143575 [Aspergillus flavus]
MEKRPVTTKQWIQVLSAFVVFLNTWGILLSFGTAGCRSGANAYTLRHFQEPSYETR